MDNLNHRVRFYDRLALACARLPHVQRSHSSLICRLSGERMHEDNLPMALPDGHVYSHDALLARAAPDGSFRHPLTNETLHLAQLRKAFFL